MNTEFWFGFLGPNDWVGTPSNPIYHLVPEVFAADYAAAMPDTIVWGWEPPPHEVKQCTLKRAHVRHSWWSRKLQCYFTCTGSHGPGDGRLTQVNPRPRKDTPS